MQYLHVHVQNAGKNQIQMLLASRWLLCVLNADLPPLINVKLWHPYVLKFVVLLLVEKQSVQKRNHVMRAQQSLIKRIFKRKLLRNYVNAVNVDHWKLLKAVMHVNKIMKFNFCSKSIFYYFLKILMLFFSIDFIIF